jgi:phage terminase large subunit GpA-like protein
MTPYLREVVDTLSPYHPAKIIAVMKGAQIGFTEGVIVNGILWIIANNPGNIMALSANDQLSKEMIESRLDQGITSCGIQHMIRPNTIRKRNQRTGDTSNYKEFAGGRLFAGGLNSIDKLGKQRSIKYGFFDDWDAAPISDKEQGNIFELLQQRFSTAANSMKQYYISTPQTRPSNIEKVYLMGDQRKWKVPCPKCGAYIEIIWHEKKEGERIGIVFDKDESGRLIESSVGYVCQECGQFWKERYKYDINLEGLWIPSTEPFRSGLYSYHIPCFISAPGMYSWTDYAYKWLDIYKDGQESISKRKVFRNVVEGLPWEERQDHIKSNRLSMNTREYDVGCVPRKVSLDDGNGQIVLLTCACDLNGLLDDARMDYEVVGHSESGSTYSILHGSIGTFQPGKKNGEREKWTYRNGEPNNVWDYFYNEVVNRDYMADDDSIMRILLTGVDTGYYTHYAYSFIDNYVEQLIGVKGDINDKFRKINHDVPMFKPSRERQRLYILEVDLIKDKLAERVNLKANKPQPSGFMNFPSPSNGLYSVPGYFLHYEAEEKVLEQSDDGETTGWKWVKKHSSVQNHFFDCAVYNLILRDIVVKKVCDEMKIKNGTWQDFCGIMSTL